MVKAYFPISFGIGNALCKIIVKYLFEIYNEQYYIKEAVSYF